MSVLPAGRYYYEIVWYELGRRRADVYSGAVETIVREGEKLGLDDYEIDYRIDNLVEGEATFFPCTNFIAGPFCEERESPREQTETQPPTSRDASLFFG